MLTYFKIRNDASEKMACGNTDDQRDFLLEISFSDIVAELILIILIIITNGRNMSAKM